MLTASFTGSTIAHQLSKSFSILVQPIFSLTVMCCSINPIGGISKTDLKRFIHWASQKENFGLGLLQEFLDAPPTAELEPLTESYVQVRDCMIKIAISKGGTMLTKLYRRTRQIWQRLSLPSQPQIFWRLAGHDLQWTKRLRPLAKDWVRYHQILARLDNGLQCDKKVNSGSTACGRSCFTFGATRFPRNKYTRKCVSFRGTMRYVRGRSFFPIRVCFGSQPDFFSQSRTFPLEDCLRNRPELKFFLRPSKISRN